MDERIRKILNEIVEKLKNDYKPQKIILYGSYAYGDPTEESDLDLFILKNTNKRRTDRFLEVKRIIYDPKRIIPISPLVYTPNELEERIQLEDDFILEILKKGITIYERQIS